MRAWVEAMVRLCDDDGLVRALGWFDGQVPPSVRRSATLAALSLGERNPARASEFARAVAPGQGRAEAVCWLLSATDAPLWSAREDLDFLVAAMSSTAVATRVAALAALARRTSSVVLDSILFALNDETYEVQIAAIQALGRFRDSAGNAPGTRFLIDIARKNEDSEVELLALRALGHTGDPVALDFLVARVTAASALVAVAAVEALSSFEPRRFVDALIGALRHGDSEVVKAALQALSRVQDLPEGAVLECLSHPVWDVRRLAADVLGSHPSARAREALARHLAAEGESVVREAIVRSLSHYEPPGSLRTIPPPDQWQPE
jgi:HEAT repeat protein